LECFCARPAASRVGHQIAGLSDALRDAFAAEVFDCRGGRAQQHRTQPVRDEPVDFFRHVAVERAQAGLDVDDRNRKLRCGKSARQSGVRVAINENGIGLLGDEGFLDCCQHAPRHRAVAAAMNVEVTAGWRNPEFREEYLGHVGVEVLAGMDEDFLEARMGTHGARKRKGLDELRSRAEHADEANNLLAAVRMRRVDGQRSHRFREHVNYQPGKLARPESRG